MYESNCWAKLLSWELGHIRCDLPYEKSILAIQSKPLPMWLIVAGLGWPQIVHSLLYWRILWDGWTGLWKEPLQMACQTSNGFSSSSPKACCKRSISKYLEQLNQQEVVRRWFESNTAIVVQSAQNGVKIDAADWNAKITLKTRFLSKPMTYLHSIEY